ncbi:MAG: radical SAM protein [Candidatus Omnitrophica bacterium]|nr:radical SAM protein [Candidatus Omnitrophota bacterium]
MTANSLAYKEVYQRASQKCIPLGVLFELTYRCNLRCAHCYVTKGEQPDELKLDEICSIIDQLAEAGCLFLTFSGGESLLREDFFDIVNFARKRNFAIGIFTNGTTITPAIADRIRDSFPFKVEVSLYGIKKDTYEEVTRVEGSYERVRRGIDLLVERHVPLVLKTNAMRGNCHQIGQIQNFAKESGATFRCDGMIIPMIDGGRGPLKNRATDRQLENFFDVMFNKITPNWEPKFDRPRDGSICDAARSTAVIDPYGKLSPCATLRQEGCDLRERPFLEVWKESPQLNRIRALTWSDAQECGDCQLLPYCRHCLGISSLEEGDMFAALRESCRQARIKKRVYEKKIYQGTNSNL